VGFCGVTRQLIIRRLLAILMIAGLVLAPVSRPSMAGMMSDVSTSDVSMSGMAADMDISSSATMDEMASDMPNDTPCCPSKAQIPSGCDKCLFMTACAAKCFSGLTAALFQPLFAASAELANLRNDFWLDGLGQSPPEYPPRTLV
jgi:hypothetical protein